MIGKSGERRLPDLLDRLRLSLRHARQNRQPRVASLEIVGVGHQRALARGLSDLAGQNRVLAEPVDDLFAGQTLGDGELVSNHAVRNELILDLVHAHARLERVLATFQGAAIAVEHGENVEPHRAVDHARALELIGDAAAVILARDDHHFVLGKRPRASALPS